jgi:xylulose-5-phosphate/fructose-6-phosphate phosphoketolase
MTVLNQIDRYDLAMDVIDRVPRLQARAGLVRERLKNKLIEHRIYIREHGEDLPAIRDWQWTPASGPAVESHAPARNAPEA